MYSFKRFLAAFAVVLFVLTAVGASAKDVSYYQLKVYHYKTAAQFEQLNQYLEKAYVPALHRYGIKKVGVFATLPEDTADRRVYVFIPIKGLNKLEEIDQRLAADQKYIADGAAYLNAPYNGSPYTRIENILLKAFAGMPKPEVPALKSPKAERIYELRSYESATEKYHQNKVEMFNDGDEISLFKRLGFNAVFYSQVLSGARMPNLMYMTTFNNRQDRDKHWETFGSDGVWKILSAKDQYKNNVSRNEIVFLRPVEYSDF
ncbi:NIPSNAP family protein [Mucilaginibacter sp. UR6-1]|uniref:NIPSNAP family protein n=1 Tax=Mucilaginibacter sp. UR6-1 TaxID=1435643 RepID=UPI001E606227|nr:NIPSNAP family protein [Mucilaginibacter sp. UR6-1]MCC8407389.1 NIPSNAP family protein [Mucilaginibacter sp. UR6-1]